MRKYCDSPKLEGLNRHPDRSKWHEMEPDDLRISYHGYTILVGDGNSNGGEEQLVLMTSPGQDGVYRICAVAPQVDGGMRMLYSGFIARNKRHPEYWLNALKVTVTTVAYEWGASPAAASMITDRWYWYWQEDGMQSVCMGDGFPLIKEMR